MIVLATVAIEVIERTVVRSYVTNQVIISVEIIIAIRYVTVLTNVRSCFS